MYKIMASLNEAFRDISPEDTRELQSLTPEENQPNPIKQAEGQAEGGVEGQVEGSAEAEGIQLTPTTIFNQVYKDLPELFIGLTLSIITLIWMWNQKKVWYKKLILVLLPLFVTHFYLKIKHAPQPKLHYFLSILGGDKPMDTGFKHKRKSGWPFSGSSVLSHGNDNLIFIGGGKGQNDSLLIYDNNRKQFLELIQKTNLSSPEATYSAVSFDMDNNGFDDLIIGRENGVYLYQNFGNLQFKKTKILSKASMKDKVPLALSVSDYNKDGKPDVYVSNFMPMTKYRGTVFNDPNHMRGNILLKNVTTNNNDIKFIDITADTGSGGKFNTFTSAFVDLNNDSWPDLVLSHDSGEIEVLKNKKGNYFTSTLPFNKKGNWMGIGTGDIDNDGDQDLFLTNIGDDIRRDSSTYGDIKPGQQQAFAHVLLRNDGNFKFVDVTKEKGISGKGFGWGAVMADLNLDKNTDILFAENTQLYANDWVYPKPGYYYEQTSDGKFVRKFKYKNPHFGQTPLVADINNDNIKDVVWINMNGPAKAYINRNLENNNFINVKLPETAEFANAKIVLDTGTRKYYREIVQGGHGFGSDQGNTVSFGLGKSNRVKEIRVYTTRGKQYKVNNPKINSTVVMKKV